MLAEGSAPADRRDRRRMFSASRLLTIGSATLASRLLGFARDLGVATLLGAGVSADAFLGVMQAVNLVRRLLAEGALNAAFVPRWLALRTVGEPAAAAGFTRRVLIATLLGLGGMTLLAMLAAPRLAALLVPGFADDPARMIAATHYLRLAAPYLVLAGSGAVLAAVLAAQGRVAAAGLAVVAFNLVALAAVAMAVLLPRLDAGTILATSIAIAGAAQVAVMAVALARGESSAMPAIAARPAAGGAPGFWRQLPAGLLAAGAPQLALIAGTVIASAAPGAVAWLYYANRLYELPLGVVSAAIAMALTPAIAAAAARGDGAASLSRATEVALGLALPAGLAFVVLAGPIIAALFERGAFTAADTAAVAGALAILGAALPAQALEKVFAAVSFSRGDGRAPAMTALAGLTAMIGTGLLLFPRHGHLGIAAAIALGAWTSAGLLGLRLRGRGWLAIDADARRRLPRIALAALAMGLALAAAVAVSGMPASGVIRLAWLAALVVGGLAVYLAALRLTGALRWRDPATLPR